MSADTLILYLGFPLLILVFLVALYAVYKIYRNLHTVPISSPFSNQVIATVEERLRSLTAVYIVCHLIDGPGDTFAAAVISNLKQGIKYHFFVSPSTYQQEASSGNRFHGYFESCISIAHADCPDLKECGIDCNQLFEFKALDHEWNDQPPYYFYKYKPLDASPTSPRLITVRGLEQGVGIASQYETVDTVSAESIARSIGLFELEEVFFASNEEADKVIHDIGLEVGKVIDFQERSNARG